MSSLLLSWDQGSLQEGGSDLDRKRVRANRVLVSGIRGMDQDILPEEVSRTFSLSVSLTCGRVVGTNDQKA